MSRKKTSISNWGKYKSEEKWFNTEDVKQQWLKT